MATPNLRTKRKVAKALCRHTRSMEVWVRWSKITSKMRAYDANAFLMGVMLDRGGLAERAWDAAKWLASDPDIWSCSQSDSFCPMRKETVLDERRLTGVLPGVEGDQPWRDRNYLPANRGQANRDYRARTRPESGWTIQELLRQVLPRSAPRAVPTPIVDRESHGRRNPLPATSSLRGTCTGRSVGVRN